MKTKRKNLTKGRKDPETRRYVVIGVAAFVMIFATAVYAASLTYPDADIATEKDFQKYPGALFDYEVTRYPSTVSVTDFNPSQESLTIGVASQIDEVNFGAVPRGDSYATKFINLVNLRDEPAKVNVRARGEIAPYVTFNKNGVVLQPHENTTVEVRFTPKGLSTGNYSGDIEIAVKRAKDPILTNIW